MKLSDVWGKRNRADFVSTCAVWHVEWISNTMFGIRKVGDKLFYKHTNFYAKNQHGKEGICWWQHCCEDMKRSERKRPEKHLTFAPCFFK